MSASESSNLYLITGTDPARIATAGKKLVEELVGSDPDPFLCDIIGESDSVPPAEALKQTVAAVSSPPFIGGRKTVWLKNFTAFSQAGKKGPCEGHFTALCGLIERGLPADICLILTGPELDRRRKLYRLCKARGRLVEYEKPDIGQRQWSQQMARIIETRTREKGFEIVPDAVDYLVQVIGTDTTRVEPELEKLIVYSGCDPARPLTLAAARQVCLGDGETTAWAIREAMGNRDLNEVFKVTRTILRGEGDGDRAIMSMIRQSADHFYSMIQVLLLKKLNRIDGAGRLSAKLKGMSPEEKHNWAEQGIEVVNYHPYRVQRLAEQAVRFTGAELVRAVKMLRDGYWQCIGSSVPSRIVWEKIVVAVVNGSEGGRGNRQ